MNKTFAFTFAFESNLTYNLEYTYLTAEPVKTKGKYTQYNLTTEIEYLETNDVIDLFATLHKLTHDLDVKSLAVIENGRPYLDWNQADDKPIKELDMSKDEQILYRKEGNTYLWADGEINRLRPYKE